LKYAYIINATKVVKDAAGKITELRCTPTRQQEWRSHGGRAKLREQFIG